MENVLLYAAGLYAKSDDLVLYAKFDSAFLYDLAYIFGMYLARDPKQLGNIIRRARKRLGLSQKQLGEKTAMRQATISLLETGNAAARLENLLTVLAALDLELQVTPRSKDWDKEMENYL
ncbi:MAG: helix-turn-helix domain-containing protein [Chthoniobacteraceae bacterium]|nr:helix-turn-helix domain-containing protein [Chthoniobacteraceae bacterium]